MTVSRLRSSRAASILLFFGAACASPAEGGSGATGGFPGAGSGGGVLTGGASNTGGALGTGGASNTGGALGTGGASNTGGALGTGGASNTGGATDTGGSSSGGVVGDGGAITTSGGMSGGAPPLSGGSNSGGNETSATGGAIGGVPSGGSASGAGSGGASDLLPIASALNSTSGFKLEAPCGTLDPRLRSCEHSPCTNCGSGVVTFLRSNKTLGGSKGTFYDVRLRFRGILEMNQYSGGTSDHNGFYTGGQVSNANGLDGGAQYNQYVLEVSSPATVYHLNNVDQDQRDKYRMGLAGSSGVHHFGFIMDYRETIRIEGGATVSLYMLDNDRLFGRNCKPPADDFGRCELQSITEITGVQQPFDGNFIWIDVEDVATAP